MTIAELLQFAGVRLASAKIDGARIVAEVLLLHVLGVRREELYARLQDHVSPEIRDAFEKLVVRRCGHEPSAYITGHKEFYGIDLLCTSDALIPRPETELLVDLVLDWARSRRPKAGPPMIADIGTGSGAIAIAIAGNAPSARILALDPSRPALRLARENARRHGVEQRVSFVQGPILEPLRAPVDVIVANLPYIATSVYEQLAPELREHEPQRALHAGVRGPELIEELVDRAPARLAPGGLLIAEHAWDQGEWLRRYAAKAFPTACIDTKRDLAGLERALVVHTR